MDAGKIKIVAIDDNRDNLVTFQAVIGEAFPEASFFSATDGSAGLKLTAEKDPDVVLLDIVMPGMDGFEVCRRLKSDPLLRDIPVVFLTALKGDTASRIKALEVGAEAFLAKPIDAIELQAQIKAMVKIRAANAAKREEKLRLEQLVRESEDRFSVIFRESPVPAALLCVKTLKLLEVNNAWLSLTGYTNEESLGRTVEELGMIDRHTRRELVKIYYFAGSIRDEEIPVAVKSGEKREIMVSAVPVTIQGDACVIIHLVDITKRKRAENALKETLEKTRLLRDALDKVPVCVYMKDRESRYIYGNLATLDLFGCAAEELFGKEDADFFPPGTVKQIKALDNRVLEGEQTMEEVDTSGPGEDGRVFLETKTPINAAGDNQGVTGLLGISTDITESKKNERALRHWEELMRYIIEHDRSAVAVHDKAYRYIYVSKRYLEDYQVKEEDVIGKHHYDVFPDLPEKWRKAHRKALAGEVTRAEDDPYYKDDGTVEWTRWECRPWFEANGETGGFIVYTEVITERKNMELELVAAKEKAQESDRLKTAFLANMSHEIRTPMNGILGFAQILKDPRISKAQQKHFIDVIEKSGQRLLNLLNDIIDVSRIESGHRELDLSEISVHETLQYMFGFFKPGYEEQRPGVNLVMDLPEEDIQFVTDRDKLHSILVNLLRNAEKFTLEGRVVFGCHREEDSVVWYVKDTGIGIPASKQPMIFDRFFQADISFSRGYEGAGLGLSISKAFVEMMGGRIWLESESGKGSVFYFSLPLEPDSVQKESVTEEVSPSGPQRKKGEVNLLVVDDDAASFEVIKYMLENEGFRLYHAKSGEEALDFFSTQKDLDLILMDIKMPGIDGHETTRNIRKIDRDIPVIAQTAHALSGDAEKSLASGCNDYLAKPIKKEVLLKKIRKHLR